MTTDPDWSESRSTLPSVPILLGTSSGMDLAVAVKLAPKLFLNAELRHCSARNWFPVAIVTISQLGHGPSANCHASDIALLLVDRGTKMGASAFSSEHE